MNILVLLIVVLMGCGVASIISYVLAFIQYRKTRNGKNRKRRGIILLVVGMLLAYLPLKYIIGGFIFRTGMILLIVLDFITIYKFLMVKADSQS